MCKRNTHSAWISAAPAVASDTQASETAGTTASIAAIAQSDLTVKAAASSYTYEPTKTVYYSDTGSGMVKTDMYKCTYKNNKLKKSVSVIYNDDGSVEGRQTNTYSNFNQYGDPKKEVITFQDDSGTTKTTYTYTYTYNKMGQVTKQVAKSDDGVKNTATYTYKNELRHIL